MKRQLPGPLPAMVILLGDESFLRSETLEALAELSKLDLKEIRHFDGGECPWVEVHDELATISLFESSALRVAIVSDADDLVTRARGSLEKWCESPAQGSLLLLHTETLPANTRLYKLVDKSGWIVNCGLPTSARSKNCDETALKQWIEQWAGMRHRLKLKSTQARLIMNAVGPNCGLLNQELAKLALYADDQGIISDESIRAHVGSWSTRTMWEISDAIMDGKVADALTQLERVFSSGQHPIAVIPQIAWSLRRYGHAAQLVQQQRRLGKVMTADEAVKLSGFWGADLTQAPQRLRRIGLPRASRILDWLLELDLKIKGSHSHADRAILALEELCLKFVG